MISEGIEIRPFNSNDMNYFKEMFRTYFRNDLKINITDNELETVTHVISASLTSNITSLDMLLFDGELIGFINYQIDHNTSDWCERESWGFIREFYITNNMRRKGFGTKLVAHTEKVLYEKGAEHIYLTTDESDEFWSSCGYKKSGKVSDINHSIIYEK
jgi:N-acetylglutamate synthase-like GNAT family acetyltransferase